MANEICPSCGMDMGCTWEELEDIETCHICGTLPLCEDCTNCEDLIPDVVRAQMGEDDSCACSRCIDKIELKAIPAVDLPLHINKKWRTVKGKAAYDKRLSKVK